jgi:hypothetical protein
MKLATPLHERFVTIQQGSKQGNIMLSLDTFETFCMRANTPKVEIGARILSQDEPSYVGPPEDP